ncbi:MAG: hypothetical protein HY343_13035 [Lentisphaerae bacterium]|nr:hypothetical protein [Lentisphaerota bacterium]
MSATSHAGGGAGSPRWRIVTAGLLGLWLTGCTSYRFTTTLEAQGKSVPGLEPVRFTIVSVIFVTNAVPSGAINTFGSLSVTDRELGERLMATAIQCYPTLFTRDADAVPLKVMVEKTSSSSLMGVDGCVSCLTLTIVPLRETRVDEFRIQVACEVAGPSAVAKAMEDQPEFMKAVGAPVQFTRKDMGWISFFPLGLIPFPGHSDVRRVVGVGDEAVHRASGQLTLQSCVEAIVQSLRRVDKTQWEQIRRQTAPPDSR